jgi:hypothetical protein
VSRYRWALSTPRTFRLRDSGVSNRRRLGGRLHTLLTKRSCCACGLRCAFRQVGVRKVPDSAHWWRQGCGRARAARPRGLGECRDCLARGFILRGSASAGHFRLCARCCCGSRPREEARLHLQVLQARICARPLDTLLRALRLPRAEPLVFVLRGVYIYTTIVVTVHLTTQRATKGVRRSE